MTALLNKAFEAAAKLTDEQQDALARELLERIGADARWDTLFADPRSEAVLKQLSEEALDDIERGDVLDCDPATRP